MRKNRRPATTAINESDSDSSDNGGGQPPNLVIDNTPGASDSEGGQPRVEKGAAAEISDSEHGPANIKSEPRKSVNSPNPVSRNTLVAIDGERGYFSAEKAAANKIYDSEHGPANKEADSTNLKDKAKEDDLFFMTPLIVKVRPLYM